MLAFQAFCGWEVPWAVAALGRILAGALTIFLIPVGLILAIPFGLIWLLAKLGDRTLRVTKILVTGQVQEDRQ